MFEIVLLILLILLVVTFVLYVFLASSVVILSIVGFVKQYIINPIVYVVKLFKKPKVGRAKKQAKKLLTLAVEDIIDKNLVTLSRKKNQLKKYDEYGISDSSKWDNEKLFFIDNVLVAKLKETDLNKYQLESPENLQKVKKIDVHLNKAYLNEIIENKVEQYQKEHNTNKNDYELDENITPYEYEDYCAKLLKDTGWEAQSTQGSGDQGGDVLATKNNCTIILQCKMYSSPVGNKAVQEAHAAKGYYKADTAFVVSNNTYTRSAKELANSLNILLLHHSDLNNINEIINQKNKK